MGGSSDTRPFGNAILDGVDLDIEGGSPSHYTAFVNKLREYYAGADKSYYVFAAPQCPFPDHYMGEVLNNAHIDAVYVQFYNNYCGLPAYPAEAFNWAAWEDWALNVSPNKDVKVYVGAPAHITAANNGFVEIDRLREIALEKQASSSVFGGVMLWDASQAYANGRFDLAIKNALTGSGSLGPSGPSTPAPETPAPSPQVCVGTEEWVETEGYKQGSKAQNDGRLWEAKWGTARETPGGLGVWEDLGECKSEGKVHARDLRL